MTTTDDNTLGSIESHLVDGEFRVRICNAKHLNAMSVGMWEELTRVVEAANSDDDIRVVVLAGEGSKAFASGADISEFETRRNDPEQSTRFNAALRAAQEALSNCQHPTVAVIQGVCMGGGMALAMACDLRYCNNRAQFRMPAGRLGLGYELDGIRHWAKMIGASRTADLFLTARMFDGREAERIGFVHEAFSDELVDAVTEKRINDIKHLAPLTLRAAKLSLRHVLNEPGAPDRSFVDQAIQDCFRSQDHQEGQEAFLEKREPKFSGR